MQPAHSYKTRLLTALLLSSALPLAASAQNDQADVLITGGKVYEIGRAHV